MNEIKFTYFKLSLCICFDVNLKKKMLILSLNILYNMNSKLLSCDLTCNRNVNVGNISAVFQN